MVPLTTVYGVLFALHGVLLSWFIGLHSLQWLGVTPLISLLISIGGWWLWAALLALRDTVCVALCLQAWRMLGWWSLPVAFIIWAWVPWLTEQGPLGLPWATPAMGLAWMPWVNTWPEWLANGLAGTLLTVGLGRLHHKRPTALGWLTGLGLLAAALWGGWILTQPLPTVPPLNTMEVREANVLTYWPAPVRWVQGNLSIAAIRQTPVNALTPEATPYYTLLSQQQAPPGTVWILPEEGALPGIVPLVYPQAQHGFARFQALAQQRQWFIVVGCTTQSLDNQYHNSMMVIRPDGTEPGVSHKRRLVPFGEMVPFGLEGTVNKWFGYQSLFVAGPSVQAPLTLSYAGKQLVVWPLLCSDALYSEFWPLPVTQQLGHQPEHLVVVSANLGWFQQQPNPWLGLSWQHIMRYRAGVSGWPTVVVANQGPSMAIKPN
jgi:apolipoprotein N-acyltransferase